MQKIFFEGKQRKLAGGHLKMSQACFVVNAPVEFRIACHLGDEVTRPASFLFNIAVARIRFGALLQNISRL